MQRFVLTLALLGSLCLAGGLAAGCGGDGDTGRTEGRFTKTHIEGDFAAPDSHAFATTVEFGGLSGTREGVVIGDNAWIRDPGADWSAGPLSDPNVLEAVVLTSADPDFLQGADFTESLSGVDSETETLNGVETRRYDLSMEAVGTLAVLMGEDFLGGTSGLEAFEMTAWLEQDTGGLVRADVTATAPPGAFVEATDPDVSSDAIVIFSMVVNLTQINVPGTKIEPPIPPAEPPTTEEQDNPLPFESFHYTVDVEFSTS